MTVSCLLQIHRCAHRVVRPLVSAAHCAAGKFTGIAANTAQVSCVPAKKGAVGVPGALQLARKTVLSERATWW